MGRKHVAGLAVLLAVAGLVVAQGAGESPVKVSVKSGKTAAGKDEIIVILNIAKNWHVYANPVDLQDLQGAETIVKVAGKGDVNAEVKYPQGTVVDDKLVGKYRVYKGEVAIPVYVQRSAGGGPLEVSVRYQACDDKRCLAPVTFKQTVP